jgi:HNH endonuclease
MIRIDFSNATKRIIERRATDMAGRMWCEQCGAECLSRADFEVDHVLAEGIRPANDNNRAPLTADDGKLLCLKCHDQKTRRDVFEIAKSKRMGKKHRVVGKGQTEIARRFSVKQQEPER